MTNPTTQDNSEVTPMYDDEMIIGLFNNFLAEGGDPKVTAFKKHLDQLINAKVKPLCGGKGKSSVDGDWRSELKARFSGRGAKWVIVSLGEINPTISELESQGVDCNDYKTYIEANGAAWIRFAGPRVAKGNNCASFEVRTGGSTIDHPKQLHYIPVSLLEETIRPLGGTPHSLKLEQLAMTPIVNEVSSEVLLDEPNDTVIGDFVVSSPVVEDDDEVEIELSAYELDPLDDGGSAWADDDNEAPETDDPAEWEEFLKTQGLSAEDDLESEDYDQFNEDIF